MSIPNEAVMEMVAELAADKVRERIMKDHGDLIHDAIGDAVLEVLGEDFVTALIKENDEAYIDIMMDLMSRIVITAV